MAGLTGRKQVIVMPMAGMRGPGRRAKGRSRATAAVLISATVVLAVLVGVGVVAFLHSRSSTTAQGGQVRLSNKITSQQSVGLANLGRTGQAGSPGSSSTLLSGGAGGLVFTPSSGGESVQSSQQWQADEMGSGGLVLLFSASGQCLTAVGRGAQATAPAGPLQHRLEPALVSPLPAHRLPRPRLLAAQERLQRALPGAEQRLVGRVRGGSLAEVLHSQAVGPAHHVLVGVLIFRNEDPPGPLT